MTDLAGTLEQANQPAEVTTVLALIDRQKPELAKVLGSPAQVERFARIVQTEMRRTPKLFECEPASLLGAMMLSAQLGLEPGPLGHVYLVPFGREVTFIVGYKGMVELAYRSGQVKDVTARVVRDGDSFDYREGTRPFLDHRPAGPPGEREWTHAYAVARTKAGGAPFAVLYPEDVARAKARSASAKKPGGPWDTDTEAMWRKTAVRRLAPFLPQTAQLAEALSVDEHAAAWVEDGADGTLEVIEADNG
jgi:recombination protein RecT